MVLNSTSVLVEWEPVPEQYRRGIITHYTFYYKEWVKENGNIVVVKVPALNVTINGLRQKAEYSFQIRASTSKGTGPLSDPPKRATTEGEKNMKKSCLITTRAKLLGNRC